MRDNVPISGSFVTEKTLQFVKALAYDQFLGSNGWIEKLKKNKPEGIFGTPVTLPDDSTAPSSGTELAGAGAPKVRFRIGIQNLDSDFGFGTLLILLDIAGIRSNGFSFESRVRVGLR
ncbi:hypothetical protein TNCV_1852651 [Trichonephila clavipes]|nr:hypothetical protein TNCV_1852651 [Trichonephila clavipes]